jgi:hypothetical protein
VGKKEGRRRGGGKEGVEEGGKGEVPVRVGKKKDGYTV